MLKTMRMRSCLAGATVGAAMMMMMIAGTAAANDLCEDAIPVSLGDVVAGSTDAATWDNMPFCGTSNTAAGVWYRMVGTGDIVQLSTCNTANYDTKISVYSGSCAALTCVAGVDDAAGCAGFTTELEFNAECDVDYFILVHGFGSATGDFTLSITDVGDFAACSNDDVCNAQMVPVGVPTPFDNTGATVQAGEPNPGPGTGSSSCNSQDGWCEGETTLHNTIWFWFIAPDADILNITAEDADYQMAVWQAADCSDFGTFVEIGANDDSGIDFSPLVILDNFVPGQVYYIQIDGWNGLTGPGTLLIEAIDLPDNDVPCLAQHVAINSATPFDNTLATADPGEVSPGPGPGFNSCNSQDGWCDFETEVQNSLWYTFTAPDCGGVEIAATSGVSPQDYQLAVWQVGFCNNYATFTEIAANDDGGPDFSPLLELCDLTPGATYFIQVDGFSGFSAPGTLHVNEVICTDCNSNGIDDDCEVLFGLAYDCNCNGVPDECDVMNPAMDTNGDGYVDSCTACPGDVNCDGIVNGLDIMEVFYNLGSPGPYADVNQDGIVSIFDYYIIIWNYGAICGNCAG